MYEELLKGMRKKLVASGWLPLEKQAQMSTDILQDKLNTVLPWAMERSGIDFWVVMGKENCEDPIMKSLFTWDVPHAHRMSVLLYYYDKKTAKVRPMCVGSQSDTMDTVYENVKLPGESIWQCVSRIVEELQPEKIGVNKSSQYDFCDGLTVSTLELLKNCLSPAMAQRICSAEELSLRWLQRVTPREVTALKAIVEITQDIVKAVFNPNSIQPGVTTTTDLEWMMRNLINQLGFDFWFGPDIDLQRQGSQNERTFAAVILPGDILHCDIGLVGRYAQLNTDMQWIAYVRKPGEEDVPEGITHLLQQGNRFRDIVSGNFKDQITGNDLFFTSMEQAKAEGLIPMLYTHPIGTFGHGAGPVIGLYRNQGFIEIRGERPVELETCYALELNIHGPLPEWDNQEVAMYLEEDIYFDGTVKYLNGRQEEIIKI